MDLADRRKPIAGGTPVPLDHVFGASRWAWWLPLDPDLPPDVRQRVLGFRAGAGGAFYPSAETPLFGEEAKGL